MRDADEMLSRQAVRCRRELAHGNSANVAGTLRAMRAAGEAGLPWQVWLTAELALFSPRVGAPPELDVLLRLVRRGRRERPAAEACVSACWSGQRQAFLAFDLRRMLRLGAIAQELNDAVGGETRLFGQLCEAWCALMQEDAARCTAIAEEVARAAGEASLAELVVESRALCALAALETADAARSLELARRASLMARVESLPQPEFLAHLVLARARRFARQPHLSLRIIRALRSVVPQPWQGWLDWEWLMAGGEAETMRARTGPQPEPLSSLERVLWSVPSVEHVQALREVGACLPRPFARDSAALTTCLSTDGAAVASRVGEWQRGDAELIPEELHGVAFRAELDGSAGPVAQVVARPGAPGIRFLAQSAPDLGVPALDTHAQRRVETLLSVLSLAGPDGLSEGACFRRTYGFDYVPELHAGSLEVLLHRTRSTLGTLGRIERDERSQAKGGERAGERWIRLLLERPLVVMDPRVSLRTADRVLRLLAARGSASAKDIARDLAISLRAAQGALSELSDAQLCDRQKVGRNVAYVVEDTVFSQPSLRLQLDEILGGGKPP